MLASYCGLCGKQFQSTDTFCAGCGTPRDDTNESNTTLVSGPNAPTVLSRATPLGRTPQIAEPANMTKASAAVCELEVGGQSCGVQAVGRCAFCKRAFCAAHQAWSGQTYYIDQCAPCLAQAQADKEKRIQEVEAKWQTDKAEADEYFHSGSARNALITSGVEPVNIYQTRSMKMKKGFFSQSIQWVEKIASIRRGWILGAIDGARLVALLNVDYSQVVLTHVESYAESYKEVDINWGYSDSFWIEAARAVRQLIELHHIGTQSIFTRKIFMKQGEHASERMQALAGKSGFIRIEKGKEPGRMYEIQDKLSIGRSRECDIVLEDSGVDKLHATIINYGNGNYALRVDTEHFSTKVNGQC